MCSGDKWEGPRADLQWLVVAESFHYHRKGAYSGAPATSELVSTGTVCAAYVQYSPFPLQL